MSTSSSWLFMGWGRGRGGELPHLRDDDQFLLSILEEVTFYICLQNLRNTHTLKQSDDY